jgi:hypothetical protein
MQQFTLTLQPDQSFCKPKKFICHSFNPRTVYDESGKWYITADHFFPFGATAPILALAYLHETLRFISVY